MDMKRLLKAGLSALVVALLAVGLYIFGILPNEQTDREISSSTEDSLIADNVTEQNTSDGTGGSVSPEGAALEQEFSLDEDGSYTSKEEVALYLHEYGKLPSNYITKEEARDLGWDSRKGNLWDVAPGKSIGGSHYGNYEELLPENDYRECDIDYSGGRRNAKRIVYSDDGDIYYTEDHYNTFEELYKGEIDENSLFEP